MKIMPCWRKGKDACFPLMQALVDYVCEELSFVPGKDSGWYKLGLYTICFYVLKKFKKDI
jgi:hypothetical protein